MPGASGASKAGPRGERCSRGRRVEQRPPAGAALGAAKALRGGERAGAAGKRLDSHGFPPDFHLFRPLSHLFQRAFMLFLASFSMDFAPLWMEARRPCRSASLRRSGRRRPRRCWAAGRSRPWGRRCRSATRWETSHVGHDLDLNAYNDNKESQL